MSDHGLNHIGEEELVFIELASAYFMALRLVFSVPLEHCLSRSYQLIVQLDLCERKELFEGRQHLKHSQHLQHYMFKVLRAMLNVLLQVLKFAGKSLILL